MKKGNHRKAFEMHYVVSTAKPGQSSVCLRPQRYSEKSKATTVPHATFRLALGRGHWLWRLVACRGKLMVRPPQIKQAFRIHFFAQNAHLPVKLTNWFDVHERPANGAVLIAKTPEFRRFVPFYYLQFFTLTQNSCNRPRECSGAWLGCILELGHGCKH